MNRLDRLNRALYRKPIGSFLGLGIYAYYSVYPFLKPIKAIRVISYSLKEDTGNEN
jgi:hypothetical protein